MNFSLLILMLFRWRIMGCLVISIALTAFMRYLLPNFSDNSLVFVVCTGFVFGVFWDARARVGLGMMDKAPPIVLSRPVEALSLWFFGIVYGSILFGIFSSEAMTIFAIALSVVAVAGWHMYNSQQRAFGYYVYAASPRRMCRQPHPTAGHDD